MNLGRPLRILGLMLLALMTTRAAAQQTERGLAELEQGRISEAIRLLTAAVEDDPHKSRAVRGLAYAYLKAGQLDQATLWLKRSLELLPDDAQSQFELARILSWQPKTRAEAYLHFEQALRAEPENLEYRLTYADALSWEPAHQADAVEQFERILRRQPNNFDVRFKRAQVLNWMGRREEAIKAFQGILAARPQDKEALKGLAQAYEWSGQNDRAVEAYGRLVTADPQDSASRIALARMLSWRRETREEAYQLFEAILHKMPANTEVRMAYAEALSWEPAHRLQAITEYEHILQQDAHNRAAQVRLAMVWSWEGKLRRAEKIYDQILAQDPEEKLAILGKGEVLAWSGRNFEADRWLRRLERDEPRNTRLLLDRASASFGIGRMDRAHNLLSVLLRLEPDNAYASDLYEAVEDWHRLQVETGFSFMRQSGDPLTSKVEFNRPFLRLRFPAGAWSRVEFGYEPTDYFSRAAKRRDHNLGIGWDGQPSDHLRFSVRINLGQYDVGPTDTTGAFNVGWLVNDRLRMNFGFSRGMLLDSVQAAGGVVINNRLIGRVRANLFEYNLGYSLPVERVDFSFHYSQGVVTGSSITSNRRLGFDFGVGKSFRLGEKQYLRLGYGFTFFGFERDLGFFPTPNLTPRTGGYFSPTRFFNNTAQLSFGGKLNHRWSYFFGANLGAQQTETIFSSLGNKRLSSYAQTTQLIRLTEKVSLIASYEYINVGSAFRRNTVSAGFRFFF